MKKIILILIFSLLLLVTGCSNNKSDEPATGCFDTSEFGTSKYKISLNSINCGHPSGNNLFDISTDPVSKIYNGKKYKIYFNVKFINIYDYKAIKDYPNINSYKTVKINDKIFKYVIDSSKISLIYEPNDMDCYLLIEVSNIKFDENGNSADNAFNISINDLNNDQISGTINFKLKKN